MNKVSDAVSDAAKKAGVLRGSNVKIVLTRAEGIEILAALRKKEFSVNAFGKELGLAHGHQIYTLLFHWLMNHCKCEK